MTTGNVVTHPAEVERIGAMHRVAQSKLNTIARSVDPNIHRKR
jgi:hypothetical protein